MKLPPGLQYKNGKYIIDKFVNGTRVKKRLSVTTQAEAIEEYSRAIADITRGQHISHKAGSLTVYEVLTYYYDKHLQHISSGKDARWNIRALDRIMGTSRVMDLKKSDIETYKRTRAAEKTKSKDNTGHPISPRTIQAELQLLTMAIKYAIGDRLIPSNPVDGLCCVEVPRKKKIVLDYGLDNGEEWIRLYAAMPNHWKLFFLLMYEAGMRPSEVENLKCEWIHNYGDYELIEIPPGDEKTDFSDRRIPVSNRLREVLDPAISGKEGKLFESTDYYKMLRNALIKTGLRKEIKAKTLRKTRLTIWDPIDQAACRVAAGHVPLDPHEESYVEITNDRLMRLVGIEIDQKLKLFKQA